MSFQINALPYAPFADLFGLAESELERFAMKRMTVDSNPGFPCRVSLADAEVGETVILLNYEHLPHDSPYRSSHAIFVRQNAEQATPEPGEVPEVLGSRLLSVRAFDDKHMMVDADVVDGRHVGPLIDGFFSNPAIEYLHIHNAKPGCFAAAVTRIPVD